MCGESVRCDINKEKTLIFKWEILVVSNIENIISCICYAPLDHTRLLIHQSFFIQSVFLPSRTDGLVMERGSSLFIYHLRRVSSLRRPLTLILFTYGGKKKKTYTIERKKKIIKIYSPGLVLWCTLSHRIHSSRSQ